MKTGLLLFKRHKSIAIAVAGIAAIGIGLLLYNRSRPAGMERVIIGTPPIELSALIYIAENRHYFADNGLDVKIRDYDAGLYAVNAVLDGDADIAATGEFVIPGKAFAGKKFALIASIDKAEDNYLVARKDRKITEPADLRGKTIGVTRKTGAEFYLGRLLQLHDIKLQDVKIVDGKPADLADKMTAGDIDAVLVWQPHVYAIQNRLGTNAATWPGQNGQLFYWVLAARRDFVDAGPDIISRLLLSLAAAEEYLYDHPDNARAIVQKRLNFTDAYMGIIWPANQFALSLDFSLIAAMNDEAHWLVNNNLTAEKAVPDFKDYIYADGLKAVRPGAVNITK